MFNLKNLKDLQGDIDPKEVQRVLKECGVEDNQEENNKKIKKENGKRRRKITGKSAKKKVQ